MTTMDLNLKKEQLIAERDRLEASKKEAHEKIIKINATLRKLENVIQDAQDLFNDVPRETVIEKS